MSAKTIMSLIDENKEKIPNGLYLEIANQLKIYNKNDITNYKLVEIGYNHTRIHRNFREDDDDGDITDCILDVTFYTCKAYIEKDDEFFKPNRAFTFENKDGLNIITKSIPDCKKIFNSENESITIGYSKYVLCYIKNI